MIQQIQLWPSFLSYCPLNLGDNALYSPSVYILLLLSLFPHLDNVAPYLIENVIRVLFDPCHSVKRLYLTRATVVNQVAYLIVNLGFKLSDCFDECLSLSQNLLLKFFILQRDHVLKLVCELRIQQKLGFLHSFLKTLLYLNRNLLLDSLE